MAIHRSIDADELTLTFVLVTEDPDGPVSVVGSFNDWTPGTHPFAADPDGSRSVTVVVPVREDVYFRYLGPDGYWFDDPDADEITTEGSVLRVPAGEISTESPSETSEDAATASTDEILDGDGDADAQSAPEENQPGTPDETGERLEAVADRIDAAKSAARELVDHDVMDPSVTEAFDDEAPQSTPA